MGVHTIYKFVDYYGDGYMFYKDNETYEKLKNYISNSPNEDEEIDTSDWNQYDTVRVHLTHDCSELPKVFIWDGTKVVYPFFNGTCNESDGRIHCEIDESISVSGFMPNIFWAFHDYDPGEVFYSDEYRLPSTIGFTNLGDWADEIEENTCTIDDVYTCDGNATVTICNFDRNKHLIFIGEFNNEIADYIRDSRPYDFDISNIISVNDMNLCMDDIYEHCGGSPGDYYFFIHNYHMGLDYNIQDDEPEVFVSSGPSKVFGGTKKKEKIIDTSVKCCSSTSNGSRCSNKAQPDGLCGKHKRNRRNR